MAKNFFMLFSSGAVLRAKLAKLTAHFGATLYPYPEEPSARQAALLRLQVQLDRWIDLSPGCEGPSVAEPCSVRVV